MHGTCASYQAYAAAAFLIVASSAMQAVDSEGCMPLHWAAAAGHLDVAKKLLRSGASSSAVGQVGR